MDQTNIKEQIKEYIKETIVQNDQTDIEFDTPLISGGVIDSISTLKMVDFLESAFKIEVQPHEVDRDNLDTVNLISEFVLGKINVK